jgi:DNA gyrase/topoisomerase IV subunit B
VNALSEELEVEIWRDGATWEQSYSKGEPDQQAEEVGAAKRRGTKVHFLPDKGFSRRRNTTTTRWRSGCASWPS